MRIFILVLMMLSMNEMAISQQLSGNQEDIDAILENIEKFSSYVMESNYDKIAEC